VTGDSKDVAITNTALYLLWAYAPTVPVSATSYAQHTVYGLGSVNFLAAAGSGGVGTVPPTTPAPTTPAPTTPAPATATPTTPAPTTAAPTLPAAAAASYTTPNGVMAIAWTVNGGSSITFTLRANVTGWVSVGLNSVALMAGADMYVGWVATTGGAVTTVIDTYATGRSTPTLDTAGGGTSDVTGVSGTRTSTSLTVTFTRPLTTGDARDYAISNAGLYLLWAYSSQVPVSSTAYAQHNWDGSVYVNLLAAAGGGATLPPTTLPPTTPTPTTPAPATATPTTSPDASYTSPNGEFSLLWTLSPDRAFITFTMTSPSAGWLSVGLGPSPLMNGADMYVGWVDGGNVAHVYDTYGVGHNQPPLDSELGGTSNVDQVTGTQVHVPP
jgi:hypothetical protein